MDIVTAAQFDKDISAKLKSLPVRCGFEAEFASILPHKLVAGALAYFLEHPDATEITDDVTKTHNDFNVSSNYIDSTRTAKGYDKWSIESDSSVPTHGVHTYKVELVSPVMSLPDMLRGLKSACAMMRAHYFGSERINGRSPSEHEESYPLALTERQTGLHLTFSIGDLPARSADVLKLATLVGEPYWAKSFSRVNYFYAVDTYHHFNKHLELAYVDHSDLSIESVAKLYVDAIFDARGYQSASVEIPSWIKVEVRDLLSRLQTADQKYSAVNTAKADKGLLEFRLPGGAAYEHDYNSIAVLAERFAYAFYASADPEAYKDYYKSKLIRYAIKHLTQVKSTISNKSTVSFSELQPQIRVIKGRTFLSLNKPGKRPQPMLIWPLLEVGHEAYAFDWGRDPDPVDLTTLDDSGNRKVYHFERLRGRSLEMYCKDTYHLIKDADDARNYYQNYVMPKTVLDIKGSPVTVVSEMDPGGEDASLLVGPLSASAEDLAAMEPGVAAIVRQADKLYPVTGIGDLYPLFDRIENNANALEIIAKLHTKYHDMILARVNEHPTESLDLWTDPLTPGRLDIKWSLSSAFTPKDAALAFSILKILDTFSSYGTRIIDALNPHYGKLTKIPDLEFHYRLIKYIAGIDTRGSIAMYEVPENKIQFIADTLSFLPFAKRANILSAVIDGNNLTLGGKGVCAGTIGLIKDLPDLPNVFAIDDVHDTSITNTLSYKFASYICEGYTADKTFAAYVRENLPNMYASLDAVRGAAQTESLPENPDIYPIIKVIRSQAHINGFAYSAMQRLVSETTKAIERDSLNVSKLGLPAQEALCSLFYGALLRGLIHDDSIPANLKQDKFALFVVRDFGTQMIQDNVGTSILGYMKSLKGELYRYALAGKDNPAADGAWFGSVAAYGSDVYGLSALGDGSASFYAEAVKKSGKRSKEFIQGFMSGVLSSLPENLVTTPLPSCVLFDIVSQDVAKLVKSGGSDDVIAGLSAQFSSYSRASKGKAKLVAGDLTEYPSITKPTFTEVQGAFPADFPEKAKLTPRELASLFVPSLGALVEPSRIAGVSKSKLLASHLGAYSVAELVELIKMPPIHQDVACLGNSLLRSLQTAIDGNPDNIIFTAVNTNLILAVEQVGDTVLDDMLATYFIRFGWFLEKSRLYAGGPSADSSKEIIDYFICLASRGSNRVVSTYEADPVDFISYAHIDALSAESFASKDFVLFYKFLIKNKLTQHSVSYNLRKLLNVYKSKYQDEKLRVALIDSLFKEADKKKTTVPSDVMETYGYPDSAR